MEQYLKSWRPETHHTSSYDSCLLEFVALLESELGWSVKLGNGPLLSLDVCRLERRDYEIEVSRAGHRIGTFPLMVGSTLCPVRSEPGGFFVIKGNERVVVPQEKLRDGVPIAFKRAGPKRPARMSMKISKDWNLTTEYSIDSQGEYTVNGKETLLPCPDALTAAWNAWDGTPSDLNDSAFKALCTSGNMLYQRAKQLIRSMRKAVVLTGTLSAVTQRLNVSLSTGRFGARKAASQTLTSASIHDRISALMAVRVPQFHLEKMPPTVVAPRRVHPSSFGLVCPVESPEGGDTGLVKRLAMGAHVDPLTGVIKAVRFKQGLEQRYDVNSGIVSFDELVRDGDCRYMDVNPADHRTDDCLKGSGFLGYIGAHLPFADHTQSTRNSSSAIFLKQAASRPVGNSFQKTTYELLNPEPPLVSTATARTLGESWCGQTAWVAILSWGGQNQEDAVILNAASVRAGFLRVRVRHMYETSATQNVSAGRDELFGGVAARCCSADGLPIPGMRITTGEVLVGKVTSVRGGTFVEDSSFRYDGEDAVIETVQRWTDATGRDCVRVTVYYDHSPEVGDKLATRHGQKATVGAIMEPEELPSTADGHTPDVLMNPHAFPSRMTLGQLAESLMGYLVLEHGALGDGTPFTGVSFETLIREVGHDGSVPMFFAGEALKNTVTFGPTYMMVLARHAVRGSAHARRTGPLDLITRQPTHGRSNRGGLKLGNMELDALVAHGAFTLLREFTCDLSDPYDCGGQHGCPPGRCAMPYSLVYLRHIMRAYGVETRL